MNPYALLTRCFDLIEDDCDDVELAAIVAMTCASVDTLETSAWLLENVLHFKSLKSTADSDLIGEGEALTASLAMQALRSDARHLCG